MFKGIKKTYEPREGYTAEDKYIADTKVGSTVKEQFDWLTKTINNFGIYSLQKKQQILLVLLR